MKTWMKVAVFSLMGVSTVIGLSGCSNGDSITPPSKARTDRVYLVTARSGEISPAGEENEASRFTLEGVGKEIIWYSDRPARKTGKTDTGQLVNSWDSFYGETRPNAVLSFTLPGTQDTQIIYLTIDRPEYDVLQSSFTFDAVILNSTQTITLENLTFGTCVLNILNNVAEGEEASTIIQHSKRAVLGSAGRNGEYTKKNGQYTVLLEEVIPETVFVENAPGRSFYAEIVGPFFLDQWEDRFADGLPNASLYGVTESGELDIYILTLSNPDIDQAAGSIRYTASPLLDDDKDLPVSLGAAMLLIDSSNGVEEIPDICNTTGGRTLFVSNNCGAKSDACTDKKSVNVSSNAIQFQPACLQNLCAGSPPVTVNLPEGSNYAFWVGEYGSSTLCEVDIGIDGGWDAYNLSFNKGFDIGMTLVAPVGMVVPKIVAKTSKAYSAYPLPSTLPDCWAAPCTQPNYSHPPIAGGTYHLFLCNQPDEEASTPGSYGCALNECPPGGDMNKCPGWTTLPCQGTPKLTGVGDCYESCPGT